MGYSLIYRPDKLPMRDVTPSVSVQMQPIGGPSCLADCCYSVLQEHNDSDGSDPTQRQCCACIPRTKFSRCHDAFHYRKGDGGWGKERTEECAEKTAWVETNEMTRSK